MVIAVPALTHDFVIDDVRCQLIWQSTAATAHTTYQVGMFDCRWARGGCAHDVRQSGPYVLKFARSPVMAFGVETVTKYIVGRDDVSGNKVSRLVKLAARCEYNTNSCKGLRCI